MNITCERDKFCPEQVLMNSPAVCLDLSFHFLLAASCESEQCMVGFLRKCETCTQSLFLLFLKDREQLKLFLVPLHCPDLLNLAFFCFVHLEAPWIVLKSNPSLKNLFLWVFSHQRCQVWVPLTLFSPLSTHHYRLCKLNSSAGLEIGIYKLSL